MRKCMNTLELELDEHNAECGICQDVFPMHDIYMTACQHTFCIGCFSRLLREDHLRCPLCREDIVSFTFRNRKQRIYTVSRDETGPHGNEHDMILNDATRLATVPNISSMQLGRPVSRQRMCAELIISILTLGNLIWFGVYMSIAERCPNAG